MESCKKHFDIFLWECTLLVLHKTIPRRFLKHFQRCQCYFVKIVKTFSWSSCWISSRCVQYIDFFWISFSGLCSTWAIVLLLWDPSHFSIFPFHLQGFSIAKESKICFFILSFVQFLSAYLSKMFKSSSKYSASIILKNFRYHPRDMCSAGSIT